ncbi:MAG: hypothetical protein AB7U43_09895 [Desulfobacter sp.]
MVKNLMLSMCLEDSLKVVISHTGGASEVLSLPLKHKTDGSVLVDCAGEGAWLPKKLIHQFAHCDEYEKVLREIRQSMSDELVPVKKAGKGPTAKSGKFEVEVKRPVYSAPPTPYGPEYEMITKTLTLGLFAITEKNGKVFSQRNVIIKKLDAGCVLPVQKSVYLALENLLAEVAIRVAKEGEQKAQEKSMLHAERHAASVLKAEEARKRKEEYQAQQIKVLIPKILKEGNGAIAFCSKNYKQTEMRRKLRSNSFSWEKLPAVPLDPQTLSLDDLQLVDAIIKISKAKSKKPDKIIEGATVKWVDWVGTSANRRRQESECEGCTVKFFGKKREIICPDGYEITKMEGPNLEIIGGVEVVP